HPGGAGARPAEGTWHRHQDALQGNAPVGRCAMTETSSAAELAELRDSVRDFLAAKSGEQQVRAAIETERGYDEDLWRQMASGLSLPGLALPEEYGGDGVGFSHAPGR